jgi:hypothetical protein
LGELGKVCPMRFVVQAKGPNGPVVRQYDHVKDAVTGALEMMSHGMSDVMLVNSDGKVYRPTDFSQLLKRGKFDA